MESPRGHGGGKSRRLPPLSGGRFLTEQILSRVSPNGGGQIVRGSTKQRVKSANRINSKPPYDMIITGQTLSGTSNVIGVNQNSRNGNQWNENNSNMENEVEYLTTYLRSHHQFLHDYVISNVDETVLDRWLQEKRAKSQRRQQSTYENVVPPSDLTNGIIIPSGKNIDDLDKEQSRNSHNRSKWNASDKRQLVQDLIQSISSTADINIIFQKLASNLSKVTDSDSFNLYLPNEDTQELSLHHHSNNRSNFDTQTEDSTTRSPVACYAFTNKEAIFTDLQKGDSRFQDGIVVVNTEERTRYLLGQPILDLDDNVCCVVELSRDEGRKSFSEDDVAITSNIALLGGLLLKCHEFYWNMNKQRKLNEFLLTVTKSIFQDIVSMDAVILKIMTYAQQMLEADRASLFLVDQRNKELFARIFDVGIATEVDRLTAEPVDIRFSTNKGVAGFVAATGQTVSISDAYSDDRFNREIDMKTGYKTKSILCMPIYIRGKIIGVVQMVNKLNGVFTKTDEESFEMFAVYCGLALHHAKLYEKIRRSEQKHKVALEVLSYHSHATEEEVNNMLRKPIPEQQMAELTNYDFSPWSVLNDDKPTYVLGMFKDLFGPVRYDIEKLCRFTLTVRKNYRNVPYHNWSHAFSVAQSMFTIIKTVGVQFTQLECLGLFVACLCHDVDHRGYTNQFMVNTSSPLATLYSTSTMEHHHFNQTINILQQEGHSIFNYLTSEEYKQVLCDIKHFILATDLAVFFSNKSRLKDILEHGTFDWQVQEYRHIGFAMSMTACDLCASSKPWDIQMETVQVVFEEFYAQGDKEKAIGKTPIPMMDRDKSDQLPVSQTGFLAGICVPCYDLLAKILPETKPMIDGTNSNLLKWQQLVEEQKVNGRIDIFTKDKIKSELEATST